MIGAVLVRIAFGTALLAAATSACSTSQDSSPPLSTDSTPSDRLTTGAGAATAVESVTFSSDGLELEGDLHLPAGPGPHPAVVLIHGSGPISRHAELAGQLAMGFGVTIPVFDQLAQGLAATGTAVLTYDKRSCGRFNSCSANAYPLPAPDLTIEDFVDDARAAVDHLRTRADVDHYRITVAGHSQGSTLVLSLLREDPDLASGVMLAAPFDPIDEALAAQAEFIEELVGGVAAATPSIAEVSELADQVAALRADASSGESVGGVSPEFWTSWMALGDAAPDVLAEIPQPVLFIFGGLDWNVPIDQAAKWQATAEGDDNVELVAVECMTHALNCVTESDPAKITAAHIGRTIDPTVVESIAAFLTPS